MATEVLLMEDVQDLGAEGDVVTVADGFARNYLLPKNLAAPVSEATRRRLTKLQSQRAEVRLKTLASAKALAAKLADISLTITAKTSGDEKLYGSVGATDILNALKAQGIELDRQCLELEAPIKELGIFNVDAKIHPEIQSTIKVWVVEE